MEAVEAEKETESRWTGRWMAVTSNRRNDQWEPSGAAAPGQLGVLCPSVLRHTPLGQTVGWWGWGHHCVSYTPLWGSWWGYCIFSLVWYVLSYELVLGASFPGITFNISMCFHSPYIMRDLLSHVLSTLKKISYFSLYIPSVYVPTEFQGNPASVFAFKMESIYWFIQYGATLVMVQLDLDILLHDSCYLV